MTTMQLTIDPEFQKLIPPISTEEVTQLEANLLAEGCRDPLVVWNEHNIVLDGHHRYTSRSREVRGEMATSETRR